jgi:serine phosphatase RsbU (regulator of sigma subunit)
MPPLARKNLGREVRIALVAMAIGMVLSAFLAVGRPAQNIVPTIINGAAVGFCIYILISLLEAVFRRFIDRLPPRTQAPLHAVLFMIGGIGGWLLGLFLVSVMSGKAYPLQRLFSIRYALPFMLITGGVAVVAGLLFRSLEHLHERLNEREWAEKELELARLIQKRLLPPETIEAGGLVITSRNVPAHVVAGDFYDVVRLEDGSVVVVVADVAGKGMAASLIMASVKAVLPFVARQSATDAMRQLNEKLISELGTREFVAMIYARISDEGRHVELINAGCPDAYLMSRGGVREITVSGPRLPLGLRRNIEYEPVAFEIGPGERLLLLSDGIPEAPAENEQPLGYQRLGDIVGSLNGPGTKGVRWIDAFLEKVRSIVMPKIADDWTAVVVERL